MMNPLRFRFHRVALLVAFACVAVAARATDNHPRRVLIIRHAEKPSDNNMSGLSPEGVARAKALARLFESGPGRQNPLPKPDFVFAAKNSKVSHRSVETAKPLASALGVPVDSTFDDAQVEKLVSELSRPKYDGKTVLVVWHQGSIPALARALGSDDAPKGWSDAIFDRVWEISYTASGKARFSDLPQALFPKDSR
ncbi:MAG TPA: phosphoglycerate mutase family protein [Gemmatimonadaceae bacterium]|nr:phosphoglycerate mutase family protein [Gemmatimonadaceae bacterium]